MSDKFDYFVMLAEKRTGSNFLCSNLNQFKGITAHGEAFNPYFIGDTNREKLHGMTLEMREKDPVELLERMKADPKNLVGFRFFSTHDPRALEHFLQDERCGKIILTRNPLESYVSELIAWSTNQWKLGRGDTRKSAKVTFKLDEFRKHVAEYQAFQVKILHELQCSGQTAFYLSYEDVQDVDVLNGLARFLGVDSQIEALSTNLRRQNPGTLRDKVVNYEQMVEDLQKMDPFDLTRTPNFEPRRGPVVPGYVAAANAPLMYLPIKGGPEALVREWLKGIGGGDLLGGFNQKTLRQWKRKHSGHRSFTVVRHPVVRAHSAFCEHILETGPDGFPEIRAALLRDYDLLIPEDGVDETYTAEDHRKAFLVFLKFLKKNLTKQTSMRVDPAWASQSQVLQGFGQFALPDMVLREDQLEQGLEQLATQVGLDPYPLPEVPDSHLFPLEEIYDAEIEAAVRDAYQRDYMMFGYKALKLP
ncbi:sulfotransferase family 2 domain-containing protein [Profundibacter amoris]|uniref:Nodulation protein NodH n=1 Tax=Profundibacter amoris TaxID=2171755 RepID=A0A347UK68_9RHOB|nr:sulfotransferase family 2 domain-containing protein [Profundibacter amoris]AXX99246.1 nodulation protein NodH [Profundibacter amoris]